MSCRDAFKITLFFFICLYWFCQFNVFAYGSTNSLPTLYIPAVIGLSATIFCIWVVAREHVCPIYIVIIVIVALSIYYAALAVVMTAASSYPKHTIWPNSSNEINLLQKTFKCCGKDGPNFYARQNRTIPSSCFNGFTFYKRGCYSLLDNSISMQKWNSICSALFGMLLNLVLLIETVRIIEKQSQTQNMTRWA